MEAGETKEALTLSMGSPKGTLSSTNPPRKGFLPLPRPALSTQLGRDCRELSRLLLERARSGGWDSLRDKGPCPAAAGPGSSRTLPSAGSGSQAGARHPLGLHPASCSP